MHIPIRPFASQVLQHLKENGVQIYIITSHSWTTENSDRGEKMINLVKSWLARYHIPYDALYFTREKVTLCEKLKIDCMIDDKPQNIEMISKKIPVICYHDSCNEKIEGPNVVRCYSWYDILSYLEKNF